MSSPSLQRELSAAAAALGRQDPAAAEQAARRALALDQNHADAWNLLGLALAHGGRAEGGVAALQHAVRLRPGYRNAWDNLIAVLEHMGQVEVAAGVALEALRRAASSAEQCHAAGVLCFRAGQSERAADCFEQALARQPGQRKAAHDLAVVRHMQQRDAEAREQIAALIATPPVALHERASFAAIYSRATEPVQLNQALAQAEAVLHVEPEHVGVLDSGAIVLGKLGRRAEAEQWARRAVALAPGHAGALYTLARLLDEEGRAEAAIAALAEQPGLVEEDLRLARSLGSACLKAGQGESALRALDRALQLAPFDQLAIALRGLALYQSGRAAAARDYWRLDGLLDRRVLAVPAGYASAQAWLAALADDIRQHSRMRFEPVGLAAHGGWLTDDLLADQTPAIQGFERSLRAAIADYLAQLPVEADQPFLAAPRQGQWRINLWATRTLAGGVIDTHIHEDSWLSGAFYVCLPPDLGQGEAHAGWIEFGRPHRGLPPLPETDIFVREPKAGELLLFPSYAYHRTLPFAGEGERISISFDLAFV